MNNFLLYQYWVFLLLLREEAIYLLSSVTFDGNANEIKNVFSRTALLMTFPIVLELDFY